MANIIENNIKMLRDSRKFNQMALARSLNVSIDTIENSTLEAVGFSFAFRLNDLAVEDIEAISAINRIALNSEYMAEMLKGRHCETNT